MTPMQQHAGADVSAWQVCDRSSTHDYGFDLRLHHPVVLNLAGAIETP